MVIPTSLSFAFQTSHNSTIAGQATEMGNSSSIKFTHDKVPSQAGKIACVTGGNIGLGYAIANSLARKGATVIIASRNANKVRKAVEELKKSTGNGNIYGEIVDFNSLASVDTFVSIVSAKFDHIDILINNAGLFVPPYSKTTDGFNVSMGVNVIGNVYVTNKLLPLVLKSVAPRIITISALGINMASHPMYAKIVEDNDIGGEKLTQSDVSMDLYGVTKLIQTLYTNELHHRLAAKGIKHVYISSAHPGLVETDGLHKSDQNLFFISCFSPIFGLLAIKPDVGALSPLFLATAPYDQVAPFQATVLDEGPNIRLLNIKNKDYTVENGRKIYDQLHAAIVAKGYKLNDF